MTTQRTRAHDANIHSPRKSSQYLPHSINTSTPSESNDQISHSHTVIHSPPHRKSFAVVTDGCGRKPWIIGFNGPHLIPVMTRAVSLKRSTNNNAEEDEA
jgi:hypothetical protein